MNALVMMIERANGPTDSEPFFELVDTINISLPYLFKKTDIIKVLSAHIETERQINEDEISFVKDYIQININKQLYGPYPYDCIDIETYDK